MYFIAYAMQLLTLICALGGSALALLQLWQQRGDALALIEKVHWAITGALSLAAALLLHALFWNDFSLVYVASYTDRVLPAFYRLTAFWAGQPGSMLFWAFSVAISGSIFALTPALQAPDARHAALVLGLLLRHHGLLRPDPLLLEQSLRDAVARAAGRQRPQSPAAEPRHDLPPAAALPGLRRLHRARLSCPGPEPFRR